jgi:ribosomal protein L14E/L6E/L27E
MWLTGRLAPDFKTIADFRRDNGRGIRQACSQFVAICRKLKLLVDGVVAVDGSKFKAVNNRDRNFTPHKLEQRMKQIQESIDRYLQALDTADRTQPEDLPAKTAQIKDKVAKLRRHMRTLREVEKELHQQPDRQLSLTDPDARSMATSGRGTGVVGYNVQAAVDTRHHLIVAHDVINVGHDRDALSSMAKKAQEALGRKGIGVLADRGYYKGQEIAECEKAGVNTFVPKPMTSGSKAEGRFGKMDFIYIAKADEYRCPAGESLRRASDRVEDGVRLHVYAKYGCGDCPIKAQCTPGPSRKVTRWEHEDVLDKMQQRLDRNPQAMKIRRRTVEHVFGTLKHWMGSTHFLTKTLDHVPTEMSLHVLAYNLKRVMALLGITKTQKAMKLAGA